MSETKSFILKKTCPGDVIAVVSPLSNPSVTRVVTLSDHAPQQTLPIDWALGFIMDQGNFTLYKQGYVTFNDNDELAKMAVENGVWFDAHEFQPAQPDQTEQILAILKSGNRANILKAIETYGKDLVTETASHHVNELTTAVVTMLENVLETQLIID